MAKITKDTFIGEAMSLSNNPDATAAVFYANGMHCIGCPCHQSETIEQAAAEFGIEIDGFVAALNEASGLN